MGTLTLFCKKNWNSQIFSFTLHPKRLKKTNSTIWRFCHVKSYFKTVCPLYRKNWSLRLCPLFYSSP